MKNPSLAAKSAELQENLKFLVKFPANLKVSMRMADDGHQAFLHLRNYSRRSE
jgi:hypothetical protein